MRCIKMNALRSPTPPLSALGSYVRKTRTISSPYRLFPPPSRCGFSTKPSGSASAKDTASAAPASSSAYKPANVARIDATASFEQFVMRAAKLSSAPGAVNACWIFFVPASCIAALGDFTAPDRSSSKRAAHSLSEG